MIWRLWAFLSGAPLGVLVLWSILPQAELAAVYGAAAAGGALLLVVASWMARRRDAHELEGSGHALRAATAGWVAWPAVAAVRLDIGPGALPFAAIGLAWVAYAFWRHVRTDGPGPSAGRHLIRWAMEIGLGLGLVLVIGGVWAASDGGRVEPDERTRAAAWDLDAGVALGPESPCAPRASQATVLLDRGAGPRLADGGRTVWYEAATPDGITQVHRLSLESGEAHCWTCGEAGNNRRPSPHPSGNVVLFDTDRFATWRTPGDTEVMVVSGRGETGPARPARRVTFRPGSDESAFYDPSGRGMVWLRGVKGRASVRRAAIQTGHGGVLLTGEQDLFRAGAGWVVPLAWSPDARALVAARGHGLGPRRGEILDPATGQRRSLGANVAAGPAADFSADGSLMVMAETSTIRAAALVPESLGFAVARLSIVPTGARAGLSTGTALRWGDPAGGLVPVELGDDVSAWGAPTGVALAPQGDSLVLGQRRDDGAERLLQLDLDCG